jgi:hypothetical protein
MEKVSESVRHCRFPMKKIEEHGGIVAFNTESRSLNPMDTINAVNGT